MEAVERHSPKARIWSITVQLTTNPALGARSFRLNGQASDLVVAFASLPGAVFYHTEWQVGEDARLPPQ